MNVYVWKCVDRGSDRLYEDGLGVVVFASDEEQARQFVVDERCCMIRDDEKPDIVVQLANVVGVSDKNKVTIMPDVRVLG